MGTMYDDYDLLLEAPDATEAALAKDLLEEAGIPSLLAGRDRAIADLGSAAHNMLTQPDLFVPKGMRAQAQAVLDRSWSTEPLPEDVAVDERPETGREPD
jgi:hypothetical protein